MTFSSTAVKLMHARMSNIKNKVGSELKKAYPKKYEVYESTDCITFVLNVLKETFIAQSKKDVASNLIKYGSAEREPGKGKKFYGDLLAKALVTKHNWLGIYLSPDKFHPTDGDQEHTFATVQALKSCIYEGIPVSYAAIDYHPLSKNDPEFQSLYPYNARKLNVVDLAALKKVEFGFGISRGGWHTWLFSKGYVYEVHWDQVGPKLYDKTDITQFSWQSNCIVVPPDAKSTLAILKVNCP